MRLLKAFPFVVGDKIAHALDPKIDAEKIEHYHQMSKTGVFDEKDSLMGIAKEFVETKNLHAAIGKIRRFILFAIVVQMEEDGSGRVVVSLEALHKALAELKPAAYMLHVMFKDVILERVRGEGSDDEGEQ